MREEPRVQGQTAGRVGVEPGHPCAHPVGVELVVPGAVERVGDVDPPAVAADLDHLRPAGQRQVGRGRVRGAGGDAAEAHLPGQPWVERVAHVVPQEPAGTPRGHVQGPVVDGQVDVGDQWRYRAERLQHRRQRGSVGRLRRYVDHLRDRPPVAVAVPEPDRGGQVLDADHDAHEPVRLRRVVRRAQLQRHLVLVAQVDGLQVPAPAQVPEMQCVPVLPAQQQLTDHAVLDHRRGAPLAGHHGVVSEVPPHVVGEVLRPTVDLPRTEHVERGVVEQRHPTRTVLPVAAAERGDVDAIRSTVDGVWPGVPGALGQLLRFDHLDDRRLARVLLRVQHVDARGPQAGHDQVPALHVRVRRVRAQRAAARVPAEVVQLVAEVRQVGPADHLAVPVGCRVDVEHGDRVGSLRRAVERGDIGQRLRWCGDRFAWRGVEGGVGLPQGHRSVPFGPAGRAVSQGSPG